MEIFELPIDTNGIRRYSRWISQVLNIPYKKYIFEVETVLSDPQLGKVWTRRKIIGRLLKKYGINDQRSAEWHSKRSEMITASEVTKAFKNATPSARREIILKKVETAGSAGGGTNAACAWGTQFESVAKDIYCKLNGGGQVVDTSCVVHPVYPFLGASPDGIYFTESKSDPRWGKLIEFKCPISRKFDETTPIPDSYYHQMQMQMECTNIDECDYVEMRFVTITQTEWIASTATYKGRFAIFDSGRIDYDSGKDPEWRTKLKRGDEEFRVLHWFLANWRQSTVPRDYNWMKDHLDDLKNVWDEVLMHRANGTLPVKMNDLQTVQPDVPLVVPPPERVNPVPECYSSSVQKKNSKTLRLCFD